jgi:hypothetical protein
VLPVLVAESLNSPCWFGKKMYGSVPFKPKPVEEKIVVLEFATVHVRLWFAKAAMSRARFPIILKSAVKV